MNNMIGCFWQVTLSKYVKKILLLFVIYGCAMQIYADPLPMLNINGGASNQEYSITLQIIAVMTAMAVLPALILTMTSFTRVIIVLGMLRQAMGMSNTK